MRVLQVAAVVLASIALGETSIAPCPNIPKELYPYNTAPGWSYRKVGDGLKSPRDLIFDTEGRLLIVQDGVGLSQHTVDDHGCITTMRLLVADSSLNHGVYMTQDGRTLYASSAESVFRWAYDPSTGEITGGPVTIITGMATSTHVSRTLIVPPHRQDLLVVSHGSDGNIDPDTVNSHTARSVVKVFDVLSVPDSGYNFTTQGWNAGFGLRNEVGLAFDGNNMLWGVENSADDLNRTVDGKTTDIHTDNPAEELNYLGDVATPNDNWYGYPICYTVWKPDAIKDRVFQIGDQFVQTPTADFNDDTCKKVSVAPILSFAAHSAPLDCKFDYDYANLFVAMHGSWNRPTPIGYKVVTVPFTKTGQGSYTPAAHWWDRRGTIDVFYPPDESKCSSTTCIRPVGLAFDSQRRLFVTSDTSGEVFLLTMQSEGDA